MRRRLKTDWETLTPLLVYIQANLDQDLTLGSLGRRANLSPTHLQRVFKAAVGETPKAHVTRLRVEKAAFCLLAHESAVAEIAADCGFQNPETFIRAKISVRFALNHTDICLPMRRRP